MPFNFLPNFFSLSSTLSLSNEVYLVDILDIIIISIMVYFALLFLKHTRSFLAFLGIGFLLAFYIAAQVFNLYLTSLVLQTFSGIFLIMLVIVFQDELRRFFELVAVIGIHPRRPVQKSAIASATSAEIARAVERLANEKRGALIVLQGLESLDRHLEGGEELDSLISDTILESIFDPHSIGHDGAVVINKNRITKFGVHLPLSANLKEVRRKGTRHTAALGISESTDALAIVVSEERGEISLAYNGTLRVLNGSEELRAHVAKFLQENFPEKPYFFLESLLKKNLSIKFSALIIAVVLWFFFLLQAQTVQKDFTVPIIYRTVPEGIIVEKTEPGEIIVTLTGRGNTVFNRIDVDNLEIVIEGKELEKGANTIMLEKDFLKLPFYVSVVDFTPTNVHVTAERYITYEIPTEARTVGSVTHGVEVESVQISPKRIQILVEEGILAPSSIFTESIDLSTIDKTTTIKTRLVLPSGTRFKKDTKNEVIVEVSIK